MIVVNLVANLSDMVLDSARRYVHAISDFTVRHGRKQVPSDFTLAWRESKAPHAFTNALAPGRRHGGTTGAGR